MLLCASLLACGLQANDISETEKEQIVDIKEEKAVIPCTPEVCFIYYDGFMKERITGLHEENMEDYGYKFAFDENDLKQIIEKEVKPNSGYTAWNVRAQIVLHDDIYFIDIDGNMRSNNKHNEKYLINVNKDIGSNDKYYKINKEKLIEIMDKKDLLERSVISKG